MYRDNAQCNRAIRALLSTMPRLASEPLWTDDGPTVLACHYIEQVGSPLSFTEDALLKAAFVLADRSVVVSFGAVFGLTGKPIEALASLMVAVDRGAVAVDEWLREWER